MVSQPQYVTLHDMPFLLRPLAQELFDHKDVIYVVLTVNEEGESTVIDVGQSSETGAEPINHPERHACWERAAQGQQLLVGVHRPATDYNMAEDRVRMIHELRKEFHPLCTEQFTRSTTGA